MAETSSLNEGTSSNTQPSSKPVIREGFASCIRCGNTGVKDTFYGRGKQYCSANCVKGTILINQQQQIIQQQQNNLAYQKQFIATTATNNTASSSFINKQQFDSHLNHTSLTLASTSTSIVHKLPIKFNPHTQFSHQRQPQQQLANTNNQFNLIKEELNQTDNVNSNSISKEMKNKNTKTNGKNHNQSSSSNNTSINYEQQQSQPTKLSSKTNSFDWCSLLNKETKFKAAPVSSFKHVPASSLWYNLISNNLKIEVRHKDAPTQSDIRLSDVYWIASVIKVEGYYLLLRYEGYENDSSGDFWTNIYNPTIHQIGWAATQKKHLIAPKQIINRQADWKRYLTRSLVGAATLPFNFVDQIKECLKSNFRVGMKLEVVDKQRISSVRLATINKIIGCRLHVVYDGLEDKDNGFWCHDRSSLIHPIGWAQLVGHELRATSEYALNSLNKARNGKWSDNDADFSYFPHLKQIDLNKSNNKPNGSEIEAAQTTTKFEFVKGMKLEAIDPLNLSTICCATVTKVLRYNYLMVGIDGMSAPDGSDWFCYHATSNNIFPVGFCYLNKLQLTPPRDYPKPFNWFNYIKETRSIEAPVSLFNNEQPIHGFEKGMYLEAVDLMEPRLICVAMIKEVVGRLLKIHFNGWNESYDQWCDCESVELFPVGWCDIVGYPLEPPRDESADPSSAGLMSLNSFVFDNTIKKRGKQPYKGGRSKKRKRNNLSISEKLNGLSAKDDDELLSNADDQDSCTAIELFNSTIEDDDTTQNESITNDLNSNEIASDELARNSTRNSTVTIRPSPIALNSSQKSNGSQTDLHITDWSAQDIVNYFQNNDCGSYSNSFLEHNIDGKQLIKLTREDVWQLMQNKLGPSLKCYTLVEELKKKYLY